MKILESTKKATKEYLAEGKTKSELLDCLKELSSVHKSINYAAEYGVDKNFLKDQMLRRKILKDPSLIGL